jgi:hypothetical protein
LEFIQDGENSEEPVDILGPRFEERRRLGLVDLDLRREDN